MKAQNKTIEETVQVKKSDLKNGYEFNRQPPEYKNRQTAVLRVWESKDKADLYHHQEGNFYPSGEGPMTTISPTDIVDEGTTYPTKTEIQQLVKDETDLEIGTEEFGEKVDEWLEESKEVFWNKAEFEDEVVKPSVGRHPKIKIKVEVVDEE